MTSRSALNPLVGRSIDVILSNQDETGAYIAAPGFGTYAYSWIRDGAFIAAAMDVHGEHRSAASFHRWVARTIERYAGKVERLSEMVEDPNANSQESLDDDSALHTRFTADGGEGEAHWGNFQLDGYGFWLTSVARHIRTTSADPEPYRAAIALACRYLVMTWERPCFDCWEEYPSRRHSTTWAAVAKGLQVGGGVLGDDSAIATSELVIKRLVDSCLSDGVLPKFIPDVRQSTDQHILDQSDQAIAGHERVGRPLGDGAIDGSALLVLGSFGPFPADHPVVSGSLQAIEQRLVVDGGVYRYLEDEYYGGGLWIVLAGALVCVQDSVAPHDAKRTMAWIEAQATSAGNLGEQTSTHLRNPRTLEPWIERWGPPATPLLWSHAMYLLGAGPGTRDPLTEASN